MAFGDHPIGSPDKPNKGKEGGACNRQRCQVEPALYKMYNTHLWYCRDCMIAISEDPVNKHDWELRQRPIHGQDHFSTREQLDAIGAKADRVLEYRHVELPEFRPREFGEQPESINHTDVSENYLDGLRELFDEAVAHVLPKSKHPISVIGGYTEIGTSKEKQMQFDSHLNSIAAKLGINLDDLSESLIADMRHRFFGDPNVTGGLLDDSIIPGYDFRHAPLAPDKVTRQQRRAREREDSKGPTISSVKTLSDYKYFPSKGPKKRDRALRGK